MDYCNGTKICEANILYALNNVTGLFARCREVPKIPALPTLNNQNRDIHINRATFSRHLLKYVLFVESKGIIKHKESAAGGQMGERENCEASNDQYPCQILRWYCPKLSYGPFEF